MVMATHTPETCSSTRNSTSVSVALATRLQGGEGRAACYASCSRAVGASFTVLRLLLSLCVFVRAVVLVDWQAALCRAVTMDLSYFVLTSVTVEERAEVEPRLIARYWAAHESRRLAAGHPARTPAEAAAAHADFMLLYKASILYNLMVLFGMAWGVVERNLASLNDDNRKAGRPITPFAEFAAAQFLLNIAQRSHDMILDHAILPLIQEWRINKR